MNSIIGFYILVIRIAIVLALSGQIKGCTLAMMNHAAHSTQQGIMSYGKFSRTLFR